ncbi:Sigma70_r3 domain-containing protein/Sigma70_r2 domain-containing protein/Sigma70_r4 domain-containing protein [Cephalotus follicularis]|uniref:Sigma70_r3 domain-containing protein/Sigma70_r2 domain-containing protein/Sigma70_r4 domain-containing protein n=1 Tax=Cephalotus follicularis TaxID=3775 RepID=A0A1Q3AMP6_CEPFO|nr:Sigma70_r3 domain-containing protein/Sigma70_r2 domain-containing protein/Sigma70_r4 domain-containing protein [Cephalotus follicularis]
MSGIGFKWVLPIRSQFHISSLSRLCSSARAKETSFDQSKSPFLSVVSEQGEIICKECFKVQTCSCASLQTFENPYSEMVEADKMNMNKRSHSGFDYRSDDTIIPVGEDVIIPSTSLPETRTIHFSLLLEILNVLEETVADVVRLKLERDIRMQLGRLGALKLFDTCLSRTLVSPSCFDAPGVTTDHIGEPIGRVDGIVVHSGKKKERKSRRKSTLENTTKISSLSLLSKTIQKVDRLAFSSAKKTSSSRSRRLKMDRNEAEMVKGIKIIANLQRIRTTLEEGTGRVVSLKCWAEAAKVDEKALNQYLHFGWYCRDEILRSTRSLVLYLARNYRGLGISHEDLLQAGYMGVLQGAERFDHTRGCRFSTYAQYWIRKSMSRLVTCHGSEIRIPYPLSRAVNQIQRARKSLNNTHGKYPDDNEIAKLTGLSLGKIRSACRCQRVVGSVDQKIGDDFNAKYMELMPDMSIETPEEDVLRQHMKKDILALLEGLDSKERRVLVLRYGLKDYRTMSLEEIGRLFNVSKEWVRRIQKKAMTKLRDEVTQRNLRHYLNL